MNNVTRTERKKLRTALQTHLNKRWASYGDTATATLYRRWYGLPADTEVLFSELESWVMSVIVHRTL